MKNSSSIRRWWALSLFALSSATVAPNSGAKAAESSAAGPVLIAQLPAKDRDTSKYDLKYKLKRGDVLRYDVTHRASIRSTIDDTTQAAQTKTDSIKVWKVSDVLPSGEIEFMNVVERVHMINQLPDRNPTEYNSATDAKAPPGFEDAARAVGVPLSVVRISPHGKVLRRDIKIRQQVAEDDAPIALRLPEEPVSVNDTWDEPYTIRINLQDDVTKMLETRRHHRLKEVKNGIATIAVTYQVLSPIDAQIETQIVQRMMEGEVRFDIEKGRIVGQQMDIDKRVIGFAGPTSSMQYIMRMEEKLLIDEPKVVSKPKTSTTASRSRTSSRSSKSTNRQQPAQSASRPRSTQPSSRTLRR